MSRHYDFAKVENTRDHGRPCAKSQRRHYRRYAVLWSCVTRYCCVMALSLTIGKPYGGNEPAMRCDTSHRHTSHATPVGCGATGFKRLAVHHSETPQRAGIVLSCVPSESVLLLIFYCWRESLSSACLHAIQENPMEMSFPRPRPFPLSFRNRDAKSQGGKRTPGFLLAIVYNPKGTNLTIIRFLSTLKPGKRPPRRASTTRARRPRCSRRRGPWTLGTHPSSSTTRAPWGSRAFAPCRLRSRSRRI